jgi:formylglycine-generating enzyme required for sulfatase activity
MKLFVSYARVDKPFCLTVVDLLEAHDVWLDHRLYAGQQWWKEILRRLDWCEGFIYLLSPDSVQSEYCRREFEIAMKLGRHIFPVLIHAQTEVPVELAEVQYVDMTKGRTHESVKTLLNSIYVAEMQMQQSTIEMQTPVSAIESHHVEQPSAAPANLVGEIASAMENGHFDRAIYLIKQAMNENINSPYIDFEVLLREAEIDLERITKVKQAQRDYRQIVELVKRPRTRQVGCGAFEAFLHDFPNYDPDNIISYCPDITKGDPLPPDADGDGIPDEEEDGVPKLPMLEWINIPGGIVTLDKSIQGTEPPESEKTVSEFFISKYPVTNKQFQVFVDDQNGYADPRWWQFSEESRKWHAEHKKPRNAQFRGDERPRETVNWYEATAFCLWLSSRMNLDITLPTEWEWVQAARGSDNRVFPWGDEVDLDACNTSESKIKMTTSVTRFVKGVSPYAVYDMAGNVWEWCLNTAKHDTDLDCHGEIKRAVQGGSYLGPIDRARISFGYYIHPRAAFGSVGFRLVYHVDKDKKNGKH